MRLINGGGRTLGKRELQRLLDPNRVEQGSFPNASDVGTTKNSKDFRTNVQHRRIYSRLDRARPHRSSDNRGATDVLLRRCITSHQRMSTTNHHSDNDIFHAGCRRHPDSVVAIAVHNTWCCCVANSRPSNASDSLCPTNIDRRVRLGGGSAH